MSAQKQARVELRTLGHYLREQFGEPAHKLSIDGGFTCPNLDGTVAMLRDRGISVADPQATPKGRRILSLPLQLGGVGIAFVGD